MPEIDPRALRSAFGSFLTGVTVVTTKDEAGVPHGFTANSFASVSLDPPLLLVCPGKFLSSFSVFESCGAFSVSVLAEGQEDVSTVFAGFEGDRFSQVAWSSDGQGVPIVDGAAATFSCRTHKVIEAGDHIVLLGEVVEFSSTGQRGLGYAAGQYFSLGLERAAAAAPVSRREVLAGAIIERDGSVLLEQTESGWRPFQLNLEGRTHVRRTLSEYLSAAGMPVILGKAFSIFEDRKRGVHYTYFHALAETDAPVGLGEYVPIAALPTLTFASEAHAAMLARYALEFETRNFALYVGDESDGDIHDLENGSR